MSNNVFDTNAGIKPVGAIFNVDGDDLCEFVKDYFTSQGITGIEEVGLEPLYKDNGRRLKDVVVYLGLNRNSNVVVSKNNNAIPEEIILKIHTTSKVSLTREGVEKLGIMAMLDDNGRIRVYKANSKGNKDKVVVDLHAHKVLALYLKADPNKYICDIGRCTEIGRKTILTVTKLDRSTVRGNNRPTGDSGACLKDEVVERRNRQSNNF